MQFLKFAFVGAIGTALHYVVLILLVSMLDINPAIGAMIGATCGASFNYCFNYHFTFHSEKPHIQAMPRFLILSLTAILLNGTLVMIFHTAQLHYLLSQLLATILILTITFTISNVWVFRSHQ